MKEIVHFIQKQSEFFYYESFTVVIKNIDSFVLLFNFNLIFDLVWDSGNIFFHVSYLMIN